MRIPDISWVGIIAIPCPLAPICARGIGPAASRQSGAKVVDQCGIAGGARAPNPISKCRPVKKRVPYPRTFGSTSNAAKVTNHELLREGLIGINPAHRLLPRNPPSDWHFH